MSVDQDLDELVLLYTADGSKVVSEVRYGEFEAIVKGEANVAEHAASVVKAAYALVGGGLTLRGIVFFRFTYCFSFFFHSIIEDPIIQNVIVHMLCDIFWGWNLFSKKQCWYYGSFAQTSLALWNAKQGGG